MIRQALLILGVLIAAAPHARARQDATPVANTRIVLDAPDFDPERRRDFGAFAERVLQRVERSLRHEVQRAVTLRFRRRIDELGPEDSRVFRSWTVAFARPERSELVIVEERIKPDPPDDLESVLAHELTHVVLGDLEHRLSAHTRRVPRWLHEGLAQVVAGSRYLGGDDQLVWFRARTDRLLSMSSLSDSFPDDEDMLRVAYAESSSFVSWLDRNVGRQKVLDALRLWLSGGAKNLDAALAEIDGDWSFTWAEGDWARDLRQYGALSFLRNTCFNLLILLAIPLLFIVLYRRFLRERVAGERIDRWEQRQELERRRVARRQRSLDRPLDAFEIDFVDDGLFDENPLDETPDTDS